MISLSNVRVGTKLAVGFCSVLALLGLLGTVAFIQAGAARTTASYLASLITQVYDAGALAESINRVRANAVTYLYDPTEDHEANFRKRMEEVAEAMGHAKHDITHDKAVESINSIDESLKTFLVTFTDIIKNTQDAQKTYKDVMDPVGLKAAAVIFDVAHAADKAEDHTTASQGYQSVLEMNRTRVRVQRYLISRDSADFEGAMKASEGTMKVLNEAASQASGTNAKAFAEGAKLFEEYLAAARKVYGHTEHVNKLMHDVIDPLGSKMSTLCHDVSVMMTEYADGVADESIASLDRSKVKTVSIGVGAIAFGLVAAFVIARGITGPVRTMIDRLKDIAEGEGDLTRRIEAERKDEFGELARWFNQFVDRVHQVMKLVSTATESVNGAATNIAAASEEMAQSLRQQSEQTTQVSAAVEELSSTVAEVARKSEDATSAANGARADADTGGQVVSDTVSEMKMIADEVGTSARAVTELGKKSEEIDQIINVINDIADQTNLLALNAAIEAARAGEHGRGFAVVADEVRKLAERTTKATEEVASSIRDIQSNTGSAVTLIESGVKRVMHGVELANSAGEALGRIVEGSQTVGGMVTSIAAAATEQSAATEQIARSVERINAASNEAAQGAGQSAESATQLRREAEKLHELVGRFKI